MNLADKVLYLGGQVIQLYATNKTIASGNGTSLSLTDTNRYIIDTDSDSDTYDTTIVDDVNGNAKDMFT